MGLAFPEGGDDRLDEEVAVGQIDRVLLFLAQLVASLPEINDLIVRYDLADAPAQGLVLRDAKEAGSGCVDELDVALCVGDDDSIGHVLQHGSQPAPLLREDGHLVLELLRHVPERGGELPHFIPPAHRQAGREVPLRNPARSFCQLPHRLRRTLGDDQGEQATDQGTHQAGQQDVLPEAAHTGLDVLERQRHARESDGLPAGRVSGLYGAIHHVVAECGAVANAGSLPVGQRLPDLRSIQVVLHSRRVVVGVAQHGAIGTDESDTRLE